MVGESCSGEWLSERLVSSDDGLLLLDCRSVDEYQASHVRGSIHVTVPSIMMRRLRAGSVTVATIVGSKERKRFTDRWKSDTVVVYDGGGIIENGGGVGGEGVGGPSGTFHDVSNSDSCHLPPVTAAKSEVVTLLMGRLRTDGCRVLYLKGGFCDFQKNYNHLCVRDEQNIKNSEDSEDRALSLGLTTLRLKDITQEEQCRKEGRGTPGSAYPFPVLVMPYLFLGDAENSADLECLNRNGIRYILNVTADIPNTFETDMSFKYLQIPITDNLSQNLADFFPKAIGFIDEARGKACGVLVHCLAGISRSVTITVAYLMFTKSLSLNDAYDYLRRCKPNISPNFNFMGQLHDFEMVLRQRMCCTRCSTGPRGDAVTLSCVTCRSTKTYFSSSLALPTDSTEMTTDSVTSLSLPLKSTLSPASLMMSSMTTSSTATSISPLTSDAADCS